MFRSIEIKLPKQLQGWDSFGTVEVTKPVIPHDLPEDIKGLRIKLRTSINRGKMYPGSNGEYKAKKDRSIRLAVQKRYSSNLVVEFRSHSTLRDHTPAYAVLWFKDIPDDEEVTIDLPVWRGGKKEFTRAQHNCIENMGERAGTISLSLKLFPGLGDYHRKLKNANVKAVMECLDTAAENEETRDAMSADNDGSDSASSSSSDDDDNDKGDNDDGKRGPIDQIKDYKRERKALHRQNRGMMQWKAARTANYLKEKVNDGANTMLGTFKRHERKPDVETEV